MTPHPSHLTLTPSPTPAPIGRDAGGVPLVDLLRSGLLRLQAQEDAAAPRPAEAA